MNRTSRQVLAGAAGGLLSWLLWTALRVYAGANSGRPPSDPFHYIGPGSLFAGCLAALLAWSVCVPTVSPKSAIRQGLLGLLAGTALGGGTLFALFLFVRSSLSDGRPSGLQSLVIPWIWCLGFTLSIMLAVGISSLPTLAKMVRSVLGGVLAGILCMVVIRAAEWSPLGFLADASAESTKPFGWVTPYHFSSIGLNILSGAAMGLAWSLAETALAVGRLRLILGQSDGKDYVLAPGPNRIGATEGLEIPIFDVRVADLHAVIFKQGDQLRIRDKGSECGTWVNGVQISETAIRPGDSIQIGPYPLLVTDATGALSFSSYTYTVAPSGPTDMSTANPYPYRRFPVVEPPPPAPRDSHRFIGPFGLVHVLEPGTSDIGRNRTASIQLLHDGSVSRRHAMIVISGQRAILKDLGSRNGTYVNGELVDGERELQPGDMLRLGVTRIAYRV